MTHTIYKTGGGSQNVATLQNEKISDILWSGHKFLETTKHCCFGPLKSACEISHLTPSKIPIEKIIFTLGKL